MQGRIKTESSTADIIENIKLAKLDKGAIKEPQIKIWIDQPSNLNDGELLDVADYLREERNAITKKLVAEGLL